MEARLVCIETSGTFGGIALFFKKKIWEIKFSSDRSYSSHLFRFLPFVLQPKSSICQSNPPFSHPSAARPKDLFRSFGAYAPQDDTQGVALRPFFSCRPEAVRPKDLSSSHSEPPFCHPEPPFCHPERSEGPLPFPFSLDETDYFVVDVGPGSFTGLRVGVSLVKALTLVYEKPVIPVSSLEVLSFGYGCPDLPILSLVDAYTGEVFAGMYRWENGRLVTLLKPCLLRLEELESLIKERTLVVSETLEKWKDYLCERLSERVVFPSYPVHLSASLLGGLAMLKLSQGEAEVLSGDEVLPLYLKPSQAERKRS